MTHEKIVKESFKRVRRHMRMLASVLLEVLPKSDLRKKVTACGEDHLISIKDILLYEIDP